MRRSFSCITVAAFAILPMPFGDNSKERSNNMKTNWMFPIFMMVTMTMVAAFADMTRKTPSRIPTSDEIKKEQKEKRLYMIVDLTKSGKMAVSYLDGVPKGGWSDDYKKTKMALRKIAPGSFEYLRGKSFKITKPFYIGVFEMTQYQYEKVMGHKNNRSGSKGNMEPVENVTYIDIRGIEKGQGWPKDGAVDDKTYLGKLRKKVGIDFDLPTEVQWEYACRAGTKGDFNVDGVEMVKLGKCRDNGGQKDKHVKVGSFMPNAWGLYDMHGNVWEWCVDRSKNTSGGFSIFNWNAEPKETETDPKGPMVGLSRVLRGGSWVHGPGNCSSSRRGCADPGYRGDDVGFRLACPVGAQ